MQNCIPSITERKYYALKQFGNPNMKLQRTLEEIQNNKKLNCITKTKSFGSFGL